MCLLGASLVLPGLVPGAVAQAEENAEICEEQVECASREEAEAYTFPEFRQREGESYRLVRTEILPVESDKPDESNVEEPRPPQVELVVSPVIPQGESYEPETEMVRDGIRYRLVQTEMETAEPEEGGQVVEGSRVYSGVTERPDIPEEADFIVWDEARQENRTVRLSLARLQEVWSWREDFQATLTASPAGASEYTLGGQVVTLGEEAPGLEAHEAAVLAELGVEPERYQIQDSQWVGPAYETEQGWVREIRVTGSRYAADYTAWYVGELPAQPGTVYRSVYQEIQDPEAEAPDRYRVRAIYQREETEEPALPPAALPAAAGALTAGIFVVVWRRRKKKRKG